MTRPFPARATARRLALSGLSLWALATAAQAEDMRAPDSTDLDQVVITAARTILPASALPLTVDVIDNQSLSQQVSVSGSIIDAISTLSPSFSPTRQKLSGAGESLRGRSPLYAINGIPQSTPIRDGSRDGGTRLREAWASARPGRRRDGSASSCAGGRQRQVAPGAHTQGRGDCAQPGGDRTQQGGARRQR